ncbi:hypothetical protein D9M72_436430 [compost metagenome]
MVVGRDGLVRFLVGELRFNDAGIELARLIEQRRREPAQSVYCLLAFEADGVENLVHGLASNRLEDTHCAGEEQGVVTGVLLQIFQ